MCERNLFQIDNGDRLPWTADIIKYFHLMLTHLINLLLPRSELCNMD